MTKTHTLSPEIIGGGNVLIPSKTAPVANVKLPQEERNGLTSGTITLSPSGHIMCSVAAVGLTAWVSMHGMPATAAQETEAAATPAIDAALEDRLAALREAATDDGIAYSEESEAAMRSFLVHAEVISRPALYLMDNGNLRAVWKNLSGEQVGLQFTPDKLLQFVLFVEREGGRMSQIVGRDTATGILDQIRVLGLKPLLAS